MLHCNACDLNVRKEHSYVAFVLGVTDLCFTVRYFKMSCIYAILVPSLNIMCKIVKMYTFFFFAIRLKFCFLRSILQQICWVMCIHKTRFLSPHHRSCHWMSQRCMLSTCSYLVAVVCNKPTLYTCYFLTIDDP